MKRCKTKSTEVTELINYAKLNTTQLCQFVMYCNVRQFALDVCNVRVFKFGHTDSYFWAD